jgi:hypothetical protein
MNRPINIFFDFLKNLKDLVVSVKIGSAKATPHGAVLAQISDNTFKVKDNNGNTGICTLVPKHTNDLSDNEMSIWGLCLKSSTFLFIKDIMNNIMIDFKNIKYTWEVDHDSSQSIVLLQRAT